MRTRTTLPVPEQRCLLIVSDQCSGGSECCEGLAAGARNLTNFKINVTCWLSADIIGRTTLNDQEQSNWARLPEQILLSVFQQVQDGEWESSRLHKLAVVCTGFCEVTSQTATLCDTINLAKLSSKGLPSLIGLLQQHAPHLVEFGNNQRLHIEVLVGILLACKAPLQRLTLEAFPGAMHIIPAFTSLKRCSLILDTNTDLELLQGLMKLDDLGLKGSTVRNLQAAAVRLTALQLLHCTAYCSHDCMCVTSLIHLEIVKSSVRAFHDVGLCACTRVEQLHCDQSYIGAGDAAGDTSHSDTLNFVSTGPQLPASLACLTSLTRLAVGSRAASLQVLLDWPTCLTALQ